MLWDPIFSPLALSLSSPIEATSTALLPPCRLRQARCVYHLNNLDEIGKIFGEEGDGKWLNGCSESCCNRRDGRVGKSIPDWEALGTSFPDEEGYNDLLWFSRSFTTRFLLRIYSGKVKILEFLSMWVMAGQDTGPGAGRGNLHQAICAQASCIRPQASCLCNLHTHSVGGQIGLQVCDLGRRIQEAKH
ncbi:hypothetical protein ACS0TY_028244 [Phlomoides rotata]